MNNESIGRRPRGRPKTNDCSRFKRIIVERIKAHDQRVAEKIKMAAGRYRYVEIPAELGLFLRQLADHVIHGGMLPEPPSEDAHGMLNDLIVNCRNVVR